MSKAFEMEALVIYLAVVAVWFVLKVIANWKIFTKANVPGWKSIIPWYGEFTSYHIAWQSKLAAWLWLGTSFVGLCLFHLSTLIHNPGILSTLALLILLVSIGVSLVKNFKMARAFGKGTVFGLLLCLITPICSLILGFGKAVYKAPQE